MKTTDKIVSVALLRKKTAALRRQGVTIAFTNGCFDILHQGHVRYLGQAQKKGQALIVGLNSDASVRKVKGPKRPIVPQRARAEVLAALESVDFVVLFPEETPERLIRRLTPDVLIKGADWKGKRVAGSDWVRAHGGKVEYVRYVPKASTTNIITTVLRKCAK